ncbi:hypothetical protein EVAR_11942_1 [Eumeta japonica]|uniref:Uncharacterized protein n=1 Tax=Eumeta variegata TaxID=151549 RepID=A0A4C1U5U2_EUMVA|nr:hypothetical protein EVAR_11942_1 [Eumeta japonica]
MTILVDNFQKPMSTLIFHNVAIYLMQVSLMKKAKKIFRLAPSRNFDDYSEEAIERVLDKLPSLPTNEDAPSGCCVDQVSASPIPNSSAQIDITSSSTSKPRPTPI